MFNYKRKGPHHLIESLCHLYREDMYRNAFSVLKDAEKAEDAVQNTFLKLLKNRASLQFEADSIKAKSYCMLAVRTAALDILRQSQKIMEEPMSEDLLAPEDGLDAYIRKESVEELHRKICRLSDVYRDALVLRHFHELSFRKVAEITGVSEATARKRYQLARKKLEAMLRKEGELFE
jgi:RNA polymerase sigma-70 factor (ECF subfamily)